MLDEIIKKCLSDLSLIPAHCALTPSVPSATCTRRLTPVVISRWYAPVSMNFERNTTLMGDTSIQITQATQRLRQISAFCCLMFGAGLTACGSDSPKEIYGDYELETAKLSEDRLLGKMAPQRLQTAVSLAQNMARTTVYSFSPEGCSRTILGHREPYPCTYRRTEKSGTVVFRSQDRLGHTRFIRLSRTDTGVLMDTGQRTVALKRLTKAETR